MAGGDGLVDAVAAAAFLTATGDRTVTHGQIRVWATRGEVTRRGRDWRGRTLFLLAELEARASRDTPPRPREG